MKTAPKSTEEPLPLDDIVDGGAARLSPVESSSDQTLQRAVRLAPWCALLAAYAALAAAVYGYAVDVPYLDQWDALYPGELEPQLTLRWLLERHGDHMILPTQFVTWALYRLTSGQERVGQFFNLLLFGGVLALFARAAREGAERLPRPLLALLLVPLCSPNCWENHLWTFQSQFHFCLLGFVGAAVVIGSLREQCSWGRLLGGALILALSIVSFSAGVPAISVCVALLVADTLRRWWLGEIRPESRPVLVLVTVIAAWLLAVFVWFYDYKKLQNGSADLASPLSPVFWNFVARQVSFGFGVQSLSLFWAYGALVFVVVPVTVLMLVRPKSEPDRRAVWVHSTLVLGLLAALCCIAYGRASYPNYERISRYSEFSMGLIIPVASLWWMLLRAAPQLRRVFFGVFAVVLGLNFSETWSYADTFGRHSAQLQAGRECLYRALRHEGDAMCGELYPWPVITQLEHVKELRLSFYRTFLREERAKRRAAMRRR